MAATVATAAISLPVGQDVRQTSFVGSETSNGPVQVHPIDGKQQHQVPSDSKPQQYHDADGDECKPSPRLVILHRDPDTGFGFVAGSEKPVVVRFVKEKGPSDGKLQAEDQILEINGEDVSRAPRDRVIELVQSCKSTLKLRVCQPDRTSCNRKSSLLTAAKKAKLKNNPSRVRFAEGVLVNGSDGSASLYSSFFDSCQPFMPNVLKVFLENGQTKTFKYDDKTVVQDVLNSLREKLHLKNPHYTTLCLEHARRRNKLLLLHPQEFLSNIATRPGAHNLRCLFRVVFVPKDVSEMLLTDAMTFEYFYAQSCNDIVQERFAPEMKYEVALRLSALHLLQHSIQTGMMTSNGSKVNLKSVEREFGLKPFVPYTLMETMKVKELHKLLNHYMKQNQAQLCPPGQKCLTAMQAKVHYLRIISELPSYGAKIFPMNIRETVVESALLVSRKYGLSHVTNLRSSMPVTLARLEDIMSIKLSDHNDFCGYVDVEVHLRNSSDGVPFLRFALQENDAQEFVLTIQGYHRLIHNSPSAESTDLPYKELPVFNNVTNDRHNNHVNHYGTWKNGGTVEFDGMNGEEENEDDNDGSAESVSEDQVPEQESGGSICSRNRQHSPPPTHHHQIPDSNVNSLNRKTTSDSRLIVSGPGIQTAGDEVLAVSKESSIQQQHWLLRPDRRNSVPLKQNGSRSMNHKPEQQPAALFSQSLRNNCGPTGGTNGDIDVPSIVSMEILESAIIADQKMKRGEVEQRVAEMHQIVADAQHYLAEADSIGSGEDSDGVTHQHQQHNSVQNKEIQVNTDSDSMRSDPEFSATDSLLLIRHTTGGQEVIVNGSNGRHRQQQSQGTQIDICFPSSSDTTSETSVSTPGAASPLDRTPNGSFKNCIPFSSLKRDDANNSTTASGTAAGIITFGESLEQTFSHSISRNGCMNPTTTTSVAASAAASGIARSYLLAKHQQLLNREVDDDSESPDVSESVCPTLLDAENELIETLKKLQTEEESYLEQLPYILQHNECSVNAVGAASACILQPVSSSNGLILDQEIIDLTALPPPGEQEDQLYDNLIINNAPSGNGGHCFSARDPVVGYMNHATATTHQQNGFLTGASASGVGEGVQEDEGMGAEYANFCGPVSPAAAAAIASLHLIAGHSNGTPYSTLTRVNSSRSHVQQPLQQPCVQITNGAACDANRVAEGVRAIDDFIASVSIPPPPHATTHASLILSTDVNESVSTNDHEDEDDDLSSLIVPPPPVQEKACSQDDVIAKFWQVTDDVKKIYSTLPLLSGQPVSDSQQQQQQRFSAHQQQQQQQQRNLLEVSPKSGARELHSSSSGDSGYESIPVIIPSVPLTTHSSIPCTSAAQNNILANGVAADANDDFTVRLLLPVGDSSSGTANPTATASADTGTADYPSCLSKSSDPESKDTDWRQKNENQGNKAFTLDQATTMRRAEADVVSGKESESSSSRKLEPLVLPTRITDNEENPYEEVIESGEIISGTPIPVSGSGADGLGESSQETIVTKKEHSLAPNPAPHHPHPRRHPPPHPPLRSKPPIPPTSPSIIERRRQLAKKAGTKAKLGLMPGVREGEETEDVGVGDQQQQEEKEVNGDEELVFSESRTDAISSTMDNHDAAVTRDPMQSTALHNKNANSGQNELCGSQNEASSGIREQNRDVKSQKGKADEAAALFAQVHAQVDQLLARLEEVHESRIRCDPSTLGYRCDEKLLNQRKDELIIESRAFVTSSKLFVKCASEGSADLIDHLVDCLNLLHRMYRIAESIVVFTESEAQVTCLVDRLKEVAATFGYTISTVESIIESCAALEESAENGTENHVTPSAPSMSQLMNHATSLATSLSALMRTLRAFSSY